MIKIKYYIISFVDIIIDKTYYDLQTNHNTPYTQEILEIVLRLHLFPEYSDDLIDSSSIYTFKQRTND